METKVTQKEIKHNKSIDDKLQDPNLCMFYSVAKHKGNEGFHNCRKCDGYGQVRHNYHWLFRGNQKLKCLSYIRVQQYKTLYASVGRRE